VIHVYCQRLYKENAYAKVYIITKCSRKPKGQSIMDNPETPATLDTIHRTKKNKTKTRAQD